MNTKILLLTFLIAAAYVKQAKSSTATCLVPLLCGNTAIDACTAGCSAMCPVATALHPPQCQAAYNLDGNPTGVECVCPPACSTPITTVVPRAFLAAEQNVAVACGVREVEEAYYDCYNHKFVISWAYEDAAGCPEAIL